MKAAMKFTAVQVIALIVSVQSSVYPIGSYPGVTYIHAPPPGQTIAIQTPIVPNAVAFAEIPPSKIPAAVAVAEIPAPPGSIPTTVVGVPSPVVVSSAPQLISIAGTVPAPSDVPAAVSVFESPAPKPADQSLTVETAESVGPAEGAATTDASETTEAGNDGQYVQSGDDGSYVSTGEDGSYISTGTEGQYDSSSDGADSGSTSGEPSVDIVPLPVHQTVVAAPEHTIVSAPGHAVVAGAVPTLIAGPGPAIAVVHPGHVYVAAEGTYVAKTRGTEHIATLSGHINSASSINLEPAPGTI